MYTIINVVWYLFIVVVLAFCVFGLDALFTDIYYFIYFIHRRIKSRKHSHLTYEQLASVAEKRIGIMVACWQEANVIGDMLRHNLREIDYQNYTIYVGVYPNDQDTIDAVQTISNSNPHVCCIIGLQPGPSTKAANLNTVYDHILSEEQKTGITVEILVLHDSEDMIHPLSLKLYNYLIPKKDMIQTPVFPLETNYFNFTHWIYNDEFAENHTKNLIVREAMGGLVPSAGVGTAFSRRAIEVLIAHNPTSKPFGEDLLTEDYHSSLVIRLAGLSSIFVTQWIIRTKKTPLFFGLWSRKALFKEYIATRAHFPTKYMKSVRQKTRWIMGIAIQEWIKTGWKGNLPLQYNLLQDRRSLITLFANGFGYIILLFWLVYAGFQSYYPQYPSLGDIFNRWPFIYPLIILCTLLMLERLALRFYACWKIYGLFPAILSIPRAIYGNILNLHAVFRAYYIFFFKPRRKAPVKWDKTEHIFAHPMGLKPGEHKLGDYMVQRGHISRQQCLSTLNEQTRTGKKFGEILIEQGLITAAQLLTLLASQYNMELLSKIPDPLPKQALEKISSRQYRWLLKNQVIPVYFSPEGLLIVAITDPSDTFLIEKISTILKEYQHKYVLYTQSKVN
ncbi:MAG TPA: glycosyltransferase [Gammaproteobacteria bacterium]|nr:glycosyltransferase [Gammaproteobacteria bacterium]